MTGPDSITVLRSRWMRLAKRLRADGGADGYDKARTLDAFTAPVEGLADVLALLRRLLPKPSCCVIRGALLDGDRAKGIRRLLHMDKKTGELPTLRDVPRSWLALDLDGVPMPDGLDARDLTGCGAAALAVLPSAFHGVECIVQASAQHGRKPGLRLRVWVWLSRPTWGHELKRWLEAYPCDRAVFGGAQPIYTAAPTLADGVVDPIPDRLLLLPGRAVVDVPSAGALAPPPPPERADGVRVPDWLADKYVRGALVRAASAITGAGEGNRHPMIVAETCRLARFVKAGFLDAGVVDQVVRAAARQAGKDDEAELDAAIDYGLANPWTAGKLPGEARDA